MIDIAGSARHADYLINGFLFSGSLLVVVAIGAFFRYFLGKGLKGAPENQSIGTALSCRIRLSGLLLVMAVIGVLSLLYFSAVPIGPLAWMFCGMGAISAGLAWCCYQRTVAIALAGDQPESGIAAADCYVLLYAHYILSFAILMAMGGFASAAIPGWPRMAAGVMGTGLVGSAMVVTAGFLLRGQLRSWLTGLIAVLWAFAVLWLVRSEMLGLSTQALIDTGMLDRLGPFWAAMAGPIELSLVRLLAVRYASRSRSVFLYGRFEGPVMLLLFPCLLQWMAYLLAGYYGLGLSAGGMAIFLTMCLPFDLDRLSAPMEGAPIKALKARLCASFLVVSFAVAMAGIALTMLYLHRT